MIYVRNNLIYKENKMLSITENHNQDTINIDIKNGYEIAKLINNEDKKVALAVEKELKTIGKAIDEIAVRLQKGGRVAYFGAGTSGRIGILDASEMPPTFGVKETMFQAFIAGGRKAVRKAVENSEDSEDFASKDLAMFKPKENDVVIAISASGNPSYVVEVLKSARQKGLLTIAVSSNPEAKMRQFADIFINPIVGAEAITGSSRMKAGTAQKMVLNMLSSGAMIKIGKTYKNYMIDLQVNNAKLRERAIRFIKEITGTDEKTAEKVLLQSKSVKTACVMIVKKCTQKEAEKLLRAQNGILRKII
jgi:N-acetylmuramic acid 6-phosphate etherase